MEAVTKIKGTVVPMNLTNIDTDIIIPAQYLTSTSQSGYGEFAFSRLKVDPSFVLNQAQYQGAPILLTGKNFGCGSSREHAVWALKELGFKAVIAPSFADIFTNNAKKNGLLLIEQDEKWVDQLLIDAKSGLVELDVDIEKQTLSSKGFVNEFKIDPFFKHCLINGLDEMDYLMSHLDEIKEFKDGQISNTFFVDSKGN